MLSTVIAVPGSAFVIVMYMSLVETILKGSKVAAGVLAVQSLAATVTVSLIFWLRFRRDRQIGLLIALVAAAAIWLWGQHLWEAISSTVLPHYEGLKPAERAQAVGQYRLAVVQACAAAGGVIALLYTARNYRLIRHGQVTDRLSKALERLESQEEFVRLGGVIALQQIIHDAPAQAEHVTHIVRTFIRRQAPKAAQSTPRGLQATASGLLLPQGRTPSGPERPAADVQAALTALNTRHAKLHSYRIDLSGYHLAGAHMFRQDLARAQLSGAVLTDAILARAALGRASLEECDLRHAVLSRSDLQQATLRGAKLSGAYLVSTDLTDADLTGVTAEEEPVHLDKSYLEQARLNNAVLRNASLIGAKLRHADLTDADLTGADLTGADLRRARGLTVDQLLAAGSIEKARLDPTLHAACRRSAPGSEPAAGGPVGQE
ncbi:pentapeptide repeat-containing protein [Streptomyces lydicus]|uniref:pentapeptide repeat-containing protein n=1 Tax=Streptomyces lydicus TaxID=47763 RepID=UPI0037A93954